MNRISAFAPRRPADSYDQFGGDNSSDSSSDFDGGSSCSSCGSSEMARDDARHQQHIERVAAQLLMSKRASKKFSQKANLVKNAISAVLAREKALSTSPALVAASAATTYPIPASAASHGTGGALSDMGASMASNGDGPTAIMTALQRPRNATPPVASGTASPPSRRPSVRIGGVPTLGRRGSSVRSAAVTDLTTSEASPPEADAAMVVAAPSHEPWKPTAAEEIQISVASILKRGARTKETVAAELSATAQAQKQPVLPLKDLPSLHATLKPFSDAGHGKSVTQFGAAAMAMLFIVRIMRQSTKKTQHQENTERFSYIEKRRADKNGALAHQIAGATVRSMHLHIRKQRSGLWNLVNYAVKESNTRTRDARIGKTASARGELLKHTEDTLFDRSEYQRGDIGTRERESTTDDAQHSGDFAFAPSATELGQYLVNSSGGVSIDGRPTLPSQSSSRPAVASRGRHALHSGMSSSDFGSGTFSGGAARSHRPLHNHDVCDPHLFTLHHQWRDEPFKDTYVETEKVYQYTTQKDRSKLYAFTRTQLPNLHLEVHRLKQQLDPTPWQGSRADQQLRDQLAEKADARRAWRHAGEAQPQSARAPSPLRDDGTLVPVPSTARGASSVSRASSDVRASQRLPAATPGSLLANPAAEDGAATKRDTATPRLTLPPARGAKPAGDTPLPAASKPCSTAHPSFVQPQQSPRRHGDGAVTSRAQMNASSRGSARAGGAKDRLIVDDDTKAQRREDLAHLERIIEDEHQIAIGSFERFLLHKEMEHSVFASKSIEEIRRLVQSNDLIFPMKRSEMLRSSASPRAGQQDDPAIAAALAKKKVISVTNFDVFRQLHHAEASVKLQVKQHQQEQSIAYTSRWFASLLQAVEHHSGGLSSLARKIFKAFEPLFASRITSSDGFFRVASELSVMELQQPEAQFLLMRLSVPFKIAGDQIEQMLRKRGATLFLLDASFYRHQRELQEQDETIRVREGKLTVIESVKKINDAMERAFVAAVQPSPPACPSGGAAPAEASSFRMRHLPSVARM